MQKLTPLEFKGWMERCIRDARERGLSNLDISMELLEQVRMLSCKEQVKLGGSLGNDQ